MWILKRLRQRANKFELNRSDEHPSSVLHTFSCLWICRNSRLVFSYSNADIEIPPQVYRNSIDRLLWTTPVCQLYLHHQSICSDAFCWIYWLNFGIVPKLFLPRGVWYWTHCSKSKYADIVNVATFLRFCIYIILYLYDLIVNVFILYSYILLIKKQ